MALVYNGQGQRVCAVDAATNATWHALDAFGRLASTTNALGEVTVYEYNLQGRKTYEGGGTYPVRFAYDDEGRMTSMTTYRDESGPGDTTAWNYDPATGLLVQKRYDDGKGPSYTYTPDGKLASRTWARGITTAYAYNAAGQLTGVDYSDATPDVAYTYDRLGRQLSAITASVATNLYAYSTNTLELVSETQNGVVINRSSDAFGLASGIALESDYDVSYGYDTYGRFAAVSSAVGSASSVANYAYVPGSRLVAGYTIGGLTRAVSYEPNRNLIASVTNAWNSALISSFDYVNDEIGRRTARTDNGSVANQFAYNIRSEVASAIMGTNTYGYVFDPIGNRIVSTNNAEISTYVANELNQYTAISNEIVTLPVHDDDGNMLTNGVWSYTWDGENRLSSVFSNNVLVATHTYDHQSRRIGKAAGDTTHSFVYDGWNLIQELTHTQTHTLTNFYAWGLDLSGSLQGAGGVGGLLAVVKDSETYVPAWDGNGNVTEYVSIDGTIAAHYEYDAFGRTIAQSGDLTDSFAFRFSTKYWEDEGALYYYGHRYYSPELGRWLNRDPIGGRGGVNLYGFVGNDSISLWDKLGLLFCDCEEVFTTRADAARRIGSKVSPTADGIPDAKIVKETTPTVCPEGEAGVKWEYTCKITIYYFVPVGDARVPNLRRHENYHRDIGDAYYFKLLFNAMTGECLCIPCFNAKQAFHQAVAQRYRKEADKANVWWDCHEGNQLACTEIASLELEIFEMLRNEIRLMEEVKKECQ